MGDADDDQPVACWHTEPGTPCDWHTCNQPERLATGDTGHDPAEVIADLGSRLRSQHEHPRRLTCVTCRLRIEDLTEVARVYGEVHEDRSERYKHFKADETDPTGYRGFYYLADHSAAPAVAHAG